MAQAIETMGKWMTTEEILKEVLADEVFYSRSGGLTLSGGDPLLQAEFATALLKQAHAEGLETAIETTGCVPWESALPVFEQLDFIHMDIKSVDAEKHRTFTGHDNALILENFAKLCATFPDKPIIAHACRSWFQRYAGRSAGHCRFHQHSRRTCPQAAV